MVLPARQPVPRPNLAHLEGNALQAVSQSGAQRYPDRLHFRIASRVIVVLFLSFLSFRRRIRVSDRSLVPGSLAFQVALAHPQDNGDHPSLEPRFPPELMQVGRNDLEGPPYNILTVIMR